MLGKRKKYFLKTWEKSSQVMTFTFLKDFLKAYFDAFFRIGTMDGSMVVAHETLGIQVKKKRNIDCIYVRYRKLPLSKTPRIYSGKTRWDGSCNRPLGFFLAGAHDILHLKLMNELRKNCNKLFKNLK
jgi:hypothetical protein